jgi:hypothetical protein
MFVECPQLCRTLELTLREVETYSSTSPSLLTSTNLPMSRSLPLILALFHLRILLYQLLKQKLLMLSPPLRLPHKILNALPFSGTSWYAHEYGVEGGVEVYFFSVDTAPVLDFEYCLVGLKDLSAGFVGDMEGGWERRMQFKGGYLFDVGVL